MREIDKISDSPFTPVIGLFYNRTNVREGFFDRIQWGIP
jgi:hypothetical protein